MESYFYKTTPTEGKDKGGSRSAVRCTQEERREISEKLQAQGYVRRTQKICDGRWGYWWEKKHEATGF